MNMVHTGQVEWESRRMVGYQFEYPDLSAESRRMGRLRDIKESVNGDMGHTLK